MDPLAKALRVEPLEPKTAFGSSGGTRGAEPLCQAASVAQVRASATMHR